MKTTLKNFILTLAAFLSLLLILEILCRSAGYHSVDLAFQPLWHSNDFGWSLKPDYAHRWQELEWSVPYRTNRMGFRDQEHALAKPPGTFRILILGDSFAEGYGVREEERWSSLLRADLPGPVEVINLGVRGYDVPQEYRQFLLIGRHFRPDLVIQVLNESDFDADLQPFFDGARRCRPEFKIRQERVEFSSALMCAEEKNSRARFARLGKSIFFRSAFCVWLRHEWEQASRRWIWGRRVWNERVLGSGSDGSAAGSPEYYQTRYEEALGLIYRDFSAMARSDGFKMLALWMSPPNPPQKLSELLSETEILWADVKLTQSQRFHFDPHPNPKGQKAIAAAVLDFLQAHPNYLNGLKAGIAA